QSQNDQAQEQGQQSQNRQDTENKKENQQKDSKSNHQKDDNTSEQDGQPMKVQAQPDQSKHDDPEFRRLEAVESARDPSFLIRAQMQLQAQQKQRPQQSQKEW
ncbi:hypothetical protein ACKVMY_05590, partial [Vibrio natriegens]